MKWTERKDHIYTPENFIHTMMEWTNKIEIEEGEAFIILVTLSIIIQEIVLAGLTDRPPGKLLVKKLLLDFKMLS